MSAVHVNDIIADSIPDHQLTAAGLEERYSSRGEGEHHLIRRAEWRAAVEHQETISGYWVWVRHKLIEHAES